MKNLKLNEIQEDKNQDDVNGPYSGDILGRSSDGFVLRQLVDSFGDGFVLALNGKWGSGKTTFVRMWRRYMSKEGYKTIYYNAWKNDYIPDPLVGLIAEFNEQTEICGEKNLKKFTEYASKVGVSMLPALAGSIFKTYFGLDIGKAVTAASKEVKSILEESIENYINHQKCIKEFKKALSNYVHDLSSKNPVIFIIDELDRCKPDFAVKTLEHIKHLFSVKNIVFVLAIDKNQLCNSIRGYYGSDLIDGEDYLRRFIDVQYDLPVLNSSILVGHIFSHFGFNEIPFFRKDESFALYICFQKFVELIYLNQNLTIRQLEKWMSHTRLVVESFINANLSPEASSLIVYFYLFDTSFYYNLINEDLSDQVIFDRLLKLLIDYKYQYGTLHSYKVLAEILRMRYYHRDNLFHQRILDRDGKFLLNFDSNIVEENLLKSAFEGIKDVYIPYFDDVIIYIRNLRPQ